MTTEPREQHEPSMEEILSSIRRIIADEEAEEGHADDDELGAAEAQADALNEDADALAEAAEDDDPDDVLELTRVVRDSGEVVDLKAEGGARAGERRAAAWPAATATRTTTRSSWRRSTARRTRSRSRHPTSEHIEAGGHERRADEDRPPSEPSWSPPPPRAPRPARSPSCPRPSSGRRPRNSVADDSGRTVEQFVEDMIRPLLKEWLDENLPPIVERLVQKEIQKIARRAELCSTTSPARCPARAGVRLPGSRVRRRAGPGSGAADALRAAERRSTLLRRRLRRPSA